MLKGWPRFQKALADSPYSQKLLLVAVFYYLCVHLGLYLSFPKSDVGALWPPAAVLLTVLLTTPRRQWLGFMLAVIPAHLLAQLPLGIPILTSGVYLAAGLVGALLAAVLIEAVLGKSIRFNRLLDMVVFIAAAVVVGPFVAGFIGASVSGATVTDPEYWIGVRTWILSDALTHATFTPLLVVLFGPAAREMKRRTDVGWFELGAVAVTLVAASFVLFRHDPSETQQFHSLYYIPIPFLVWAAVRLGPAYCFASSLTIALLAVWNASRGHGPFADAEQVGAIMDLQAFLLLSFTPAALLATATTEHRRGQQALLESEEKYRLLVDNAGDMVVKVDAEGRFLFVSPAYCRVFGNSEEELIGHSFMPMVHEDDRAAVTKAMESLVSPPHTCYIEQRALTCQGWRWIAWRYTAVLDDHGNVESVIGVGRDIQQIKEADGERERLRGRLIRAEKMEALNLLAGGVAHDLNNILSGMISYPDLLLLDLPEDSDLREPLETIRESGFRAAAVVKDMAGLSRVMDINASLVPANLSRILTEYLASSEHEELMSRHPDVKVETNLDSGVLSVSCAPLQIRRAVANLVLNAIEIAEAGGAVTVRTENRYLDEPMKVFEEVPPGEYVILEVVDTGKQVSDEDRSRIFEPFFTRKVLGWGGTGLGLPVVWNVVHDHGGFVDVVSSEQGTTFTIYLPATRAVVPGPEDVESVQDYRGNGEHILVVDDEPAQRRIAQYILERLNYRVETEASGEEAIKHLESFPVDLVLLDMIMPQGMDGRETYTHLSELHPGLKAVVASGFAHVDAIQAMREAGVKRYIEKPYTVARLGREVYAELHSD